jgi:hypothetical protein
MAQSPESLAMHYKVPMWSERHWELIEQSFQQLGRIGNKTVHLRLICRTNFGDSESMVRWVPQQDGGYKYSFSIFERYLDTAEPSSLATTKLLDAGRRQVRHPWPAWDGDSYVVAWDLECRDGRNARRYDAVFLRRIGADGKGLGDDQRIAGEQGSPAFRPAVASNGKGTTLVAYERHPKTTDVTIKIGFRILRTK